MAAFTICVSETERQRTAKAGHFYMSHDSEILSMEDFLSGKYARTYKESEQCLSEM
jgi:hypothetical protein